MGLNFSAFLKKSSAKYWVLPAIFVLFRMTKLARSYRLSKKMLEIGKKKRTMRDIEIARTKVPKLDIDPELKDRIIKADVTELLELLSQEVVTSEQVLITFYERAITIGRDLELITEINFEEALSQARLCDELRKKDPSQCKGELFGLPVSIKDCFFMKGKDTSIGSACRCFNPATEDSLFVKLVKYEGAIPFIKSNVSQLMIICESGNHVWGRAKNPWNKERTVGGSSGGESGLVASGCSPMGLGNDVGGSVRIPALFCGIVGFKPTADTIPSEGQANLGPSRTGMHNIRSVTGPMAKSVRDINLIMKSLLNSNFLSTLGPHARNAYNYHRKWQEDLVYQEKPLVIGYYKNHPLFPVSPPNQRAVEESVAALRKRGHTLVEVELPYYEEFTGIYIQTLAAGGANHLFLDNLKGEPIIPEYRDLLLLAQIPDFMKPLLAQILSLVGEKRKAKFLKNSKILSAYEFMKFTVKQQNLKKEFLKFWEDNKLDALLTPGTANPAFKHTYSGKLSLALSYTFIFNVLNLPTGCVPITLVQKGEDVYPESQYKDKDSFYHWEVKNMKDSVGLPVGVQITTLPYEDEKCVNIMRQLEEEIQFNKKHPLPYHQKI